MIYRAMSAETRPLAPIAHPSLVPEDEATYATGRVMTP